MRRISDADQCKILRAQIEEPPKGETSLHAFVRLLWSLADPHPFTDGWHLHAKCEVLTAIHEGDLKDVVLNEPPGSCKSMLCNVFWPAFMWLKHDPSTRMAFGSFDQTLVDRDANKFINLLRHPLVRGAFPEFSLGGEHEKKAVQGFTNSHQGLRFGTTPGGRGTGWHFHGHIYDDLIKPASIIEGAPMEAQKSLEKASSWLRKTMSNRAIDLEKLWRLIIAQRLHESDPSGQMLATGKWEHLCFPEEYVPNAKWIIGGLTAKHEKRKLSGELLWKERRGPLALAQIKRDMADEATNEAQNQQNPATATGGILKMAHFEKHGYREFPRLVMAQIVGSFDLSFKDSQVESSRCAWQLWARIDRVDYLLDGGAEQLDYAGARAVVLAKLEDPLWSQAQAFLVEDKANGPALLSDLQKIPKLQPFEPSGTDKLARMLPFIIPTRIGTVRLPHPEAFPQHKPILEEIVKVPRGQHDDHWDCMSQGLTYLDTGASNYAGALAAWRARGRV